MTSTADYPPELTRALRHLRNWEGDPETYRSITLLLAAFDERDMKLDERNAAALRVGDTDERTALVARLRAIIEWVSERDHGRAVELDAVVHGLERFASTSNLRPDAEDVMLSADTLAEMIESQALISDRAGQLSELEAIAHQVRALAKPDRFSAIVAVHVILRRRDQILMLRRHNTGYEDGSYSVPAGHLDGGETVQAAAARELVEETGVQAEAVDIVHVMHRLVPATRTYSGSERIDYFTEVRSWTGQPHIAEPDKCDDLSWHSVRELPGNTLPYIAEALTLCLAGRSFSEYGW